MRTITSEDDKLAKLTKFQADQIAKKDKEALMKLLKSPDGRWFIMRLLDKTKLNAEVFTGNSQTFFNEGKRSVGLLMLTEISNIGIAGIKLKQKAELEYVKFQLDKRQEYFNSLENLEEGDE